MTTTSGQRLGPGTIRVGRFIGRLGVVSLPAVQVGLDLDERVVRRHVAKLEAMGWLDRGPWLWGDGSIAWLTRAGLDGTGLGGVRAVSSPPSPTTATHDVLVGWSAARTERHGRDWRSSRELAVERERWAIPVRGEHGRVTRLPDLAVWLPGSNATAPSWSSTAAGGTIARRQFSKHGATRSCPGATPRSRSTARAPPCRLDLASRPGGGP